MAGEVSALSGRVKQQTGCRDEADDPSRSGGGDETRGRDVTSDGQADHLISGGEDSLDQWPADAALGDTI